MFRQCRPAATGQQSETIVQPGEDLRDTQHRRTSSRELDREGDAIQALANRRDLFDLARSLIAGMPDARTGDEKPDRAHLQDPVMVVARGILPRKIERLQAIRALTFNPQEFTARRQYR